jgi:deoxyhypusine synthase
MSEPKQDELVAACEQWMADGWRQGQFIAKPKSLAAFVASRIAQAYGTAAEMIESSCVAATDTSHASNGIREVVADLRLAEHGKGIET